MRWFSLVVFFLLLVGCGSAEPTESVYNEESVPVIIAGDEVPAPTGEVVLTVKGNIGTTNVGDTLQFDMETLEKLGTVSYTIDDQQAEGKVVKFEGVLVSQLLAVAQASPDADTLHTIALNDYTVEIPLEDIENYPVLLATKVDGERMPIERYGPTRIVYPYHAYEMDVTIYNPRWIWQLATIEVQ